MALPVTMDDGCTLSTVTTGAASQRLPWVMLHGGPGGWDYLGPLAELLPGHTVVHRFDARGCGSSQDTTDFSVRRLVRDLECLRRHWGHDRWIVLGHSFGASVALAAALTTPHTIAAVVYLAGTGIGDWHTAYRRTRQQRWSTAEAAQRTALAGLPVRTPEQEVELLRLGALADFVHAADADAWARSRPDRPVSQAMCAAQIAEVDAWQADTVRAQCRDLTMPLLGLRGSADPRPGDTVSDLITAAPRGRLVEITGAGHFPWVERPDAVREALLEVGCAPPTAT